MDLVKTSIFPEIVGALGDALDEQGTKPQPENRSSETTRPFGKFFDEDNLASIRKIHDEGCRTLSINVTTRGNGRYDAPRWEVHCADAQRNAESCGLCTLIALIAKQYAARIGGPEGVFFRARNLLDSKLGRLTLFEHISLVRRAQPEVNNFTEENSILYIDLRYPVPDVYFGRLWLQVRKPIARTPLVGQSLDWVVQSMQTCQQTHTECLSPPFPRPEYAVPARCIYVGRTTKDTIRLVDKALVGIRYIALSYCWGKGTTLTLTSSRLEEFKTSIARSALPTTYEQAIAATRSLGFEHLWIDSCCIIQDSPADWQIESAKMGDIYRNAELVISADCGADTDTGFMYDRSTDWHSPDCIKLPEKYGGPEYLVSTASSSIPNHYFHEEPQAGPVSRRGWCFQERYSGSRIVHFKKEELVWECKTCLFCECGGTDQRIYSLRSEFRLGKQRLHEKMRQSDKTEDLSHVWYNMINDYSSRVLTVEMDCLPAISGLARQLQNPLLGDYLAGIWRKDLPAGLLWQKKTPLTAQMRPSQYLAPTWAWPSVLGAVYYNVLDNCYNYVAKVWKAECRVEGLNPYGCVSGGSLTISAPMFNTKLEQYHQTETSSDSDSDSDSGKATAAAPRSEPTLTSKDASLAQGNLCIYHPQFFADFDWVVTPDSEDVLCVMIWRGYDSGIREQDYADSERCEAIVVVPVVGQQNTYQRVGKAEFKIWERSDWKIRAPTRTITIV